MLHKVPIHRRPARSSGRHAISFAVVLTMVGALGAGCDGSSGGGAPKSAKSGGELVIGKPGEVDNLDPSVAIDGVAVDVIHMVYEGLVTLDGNKPVPALATSWKETSPTTYVFDLRKGVKFSNGREMTVDDVVASFKRLADPKTASFWAGQVGIKQVQAVGAGQVKFTLSKPRSSFVAALAATNASVLPMRELADKTYNPKKDILGTGPFKVTAHSQNESWRFVRNPYYWRPGLPKVDKVFVRIMPDETARMAALRNGSIDVTTFENTDSLRLLKGQANVKTVVQATTDFYRVDVNAKSSLFRDDRLRQALALSIDRNKIRNLALSGVGRPTAAVSAAFGGICDPAAMPFGRPDVQKARELVAAAGATGKTVEIVSIPVLPMSPAIAQVIQRDLQATGLKVRIISMEMGEAAKRIFSGGKVNFDASLAWYAGYGDPAMALRWWNPDVALFNKGFENSDSELNKLIEAGTETPPGPERMQVMRDACTRIAQNANVIPLVSKDTIVAYRSDKIAVTIPQIEGYAVPLRRLAEFTTK